MAGRIDASGGGRSVRSRGGADLARSEPVGDETDERSDARDSGRCEARDSGRWGASGITDP